MKLQSIVKLLISLGMLALVFRVIDFSSFTDTLLSIPRSIALLVILGYMLGQVISSYKWWLIARAGNIKTPYMVALKAYFIGMFVNSFGLGIVGGDVARGVLVAHGKGRKSEGIASVIADRAHGLAVLALMGAVAALLFGSAMDATFTYLLVVIGTIITAGWFLGPRLVLRLVPDGKAFRTKVEQITDVFPKDTPRVLAITTISIIFHLLQISLHWLMGYSMGLDIPWAYLLVTIPFVNILSSLPISWNGLGVRENAYIFFLATVLTKEQALVFGAIWLLGITATSAIGGIVSFLSEDFSVYLRGQKTQEATN